MIKDFGNKEASDLYHTGSCKALPRNYWKRAIYLLDVMDAVESFEELNEKGFPPSLRLHRHSGPRRAEWAIDVHKTGGWRITFLFEKGEFTQVKVEDYH